MGLGGFDTKHPLSLHMLGMHGTASANYAVDDCDFLIAVGARFDDRVAGVPAKFAPKAKHILHFDIDPSEIHKVKKADWHHVGLLPAALDALVAYGRRSGFAADFDAWHDEIAALKSTYGLNYDRDSPLDPAAVRDGDDESHHARRSDHLDRRRPASDVGGAVLRLPRAAPVAHVGQHGHDGVRPAGRDRRADREPRQARHRRRRRREHPHELGRARDRHDLRPADQDRRAEQLRRRHGHAVAAAVLQGPPVGERQVAAQEGLRQGGAGRRLRLREAPRRESTTCRACSRSS